jgi:cytochrome c-type biogenesis protein CcmH
VTRALAIAAALLALAAEPAVAQDPEPQASLPDIADEVMCVVCGVPLELAPDAPQAQAERAFIRRLIAQGKTKDEIKDALVAEYGEDVLATPGDDGFGLAAWLIPGAAILFAAIAIAIALRRWRRRDTDPTPAGEPRTDPEADEALETDMARYEL